MRKATSNNTAKATAVRLLSRRDHSVLELRRKLNQRDFPRDEIEDALEDLIKRNYLSDERFSEAYIHVRKQKGFGPLRIASELKERGVDESVYRDYLSASSGSWEQVLERVYQAKYRGSPVKDFNEKAKRMRFLQYRGFAPENIHKVVR